MRLSARAWVSLVTFLLIGLLLVGARSEIALAWQLLDDVNLWVLSLFVPLLAINYFAASESFMSYLRQRGAIKEISPLTQMRIALEFNFVNHALPSGGASGISYVTWRLSKLGVSASKATMAQVVRVATGFMAFFALLVIAVLLITIDGEVNRWIILISSGLTGLMVAATAVAWYFLSRESRMHRAAVWLARNINRVVRIVTRDSQRTVVRSQTLEAYMQEIHEDYIELKREKRRLKRPFIWNVVFILAEVAMFVTAFWAFGHLVNPAPVLIAFGLGSLAGMVVLTPGGSGAYEALMVSFLAIAGLTGSVAIAGVLLARVIILLVILAPGYALYQQAIIRYGKPRNTAER